MGRPLRTLHVDTERTWRGGEQQVLYLTTGLRERSHVADLVCQPGSPLEERARAKGVPVLPVRMHGEGDLLAALRISRIIARGRYDVIHSHTSHAHVIAGLGSRLTLHTPKRVVARRVDFRIDDDLPSRIKYRLFADRYIAVSKAVKAIMVDGGVPAQKISVVNSSVDLTRFENIDVGDLRAELRLPDNAILLVDAAYLVEHKAQKFFVQAMPEILAAFPNAYCILVGDGDQRQNLERLVSELRIRDHVIFTGFRSDALRFLKGADVSVMSSQEDGLGNSVQETLALRRPIVATNAGGIPEMVENGVNGIIVERCNPHALADGIIRMLRDPAAAARYGDMGRRIIEERFTVPTMVEKTLAVYRELLP